MVSAAGGKMSAKSARIRSLGTFRAESRAMRRKKEFFLLLKKSSNNSCQGIVLCFLDLFSNLGNSSLCLMITFGKLFQRLPACSGADCAPSDSKPNPSSAMYHTRSPFHYAIEASKRATNRRKFPKDKDRFPISSNFQEVCTPFFCQGGKRLGSSNC